MGLIYVFGFNIKATTDFIINETQIKNFADVLPLLNKEEPKRFRSME